MCQFEGCFNAVSRVFQGSFQEVSRVFQDNLKGISIELQRCFKED